MNKKHLIIIIILTLISCKVQYENTNNKNISQNNNNNNISEEQKISSDKKIIKKIKKNIQTILFHKVSSEQSLPIINLNSNEILKLSFDELDNEITNYFYTIEHFDYQWKKSNLLASEYINGFIQNEITEYNLSFNTNQKYIHYSTLIPSNNMKPLISGNYKIHVYDLFSDTIFSENFKVIENLVNIDSRVKRATLANERKTKHEIDFTIKHPNLKIQDPYSDIKVVINQNNKEYSAIRDLTPIYVKNNELIYDYNEENTFFGLNEFRHFNIESLRYFSERIKNIKKDSIKTEIILMNDLKRSFNNYSILPDLNGKYAIKSQEAWNSSVEAEYVYVNFSLIHDILNNENIYVIGEFNNWKLNNDNKLKYDYKEKKYSKSILLKQGYYNYHYAISDTTFENIDVKRIEGTHYQTRNDYYIYIYHREIGSRYDKLIGFTKTSSKELF